MQWGLPSWVPWEALCWAPSLGSLPGLQMAVGRQEGRSHGGRTACRAAGRAVWAEPHPGIWELQGAVVL